MSDDPIRLWSVTTLQDLGLPKGEALVGWAAKTVAEAAVDMHTAIDALLKADQRDEALDLLKGARWRTKGKAATRGTEVHRACEQLNLGLPVTVPEAMAPYVEQYQRFLRDHAPRFLMAEAPVYNLDYRYAGTLDTIAELGGRTLLVDVKTNYRLRDDDGAKPPYPEIALQLVAYRRAQYVGIGQATMRKHNGRRYYIYDPGAEYAAMPLVDGALALVLFPDDYTLTPVRVDEDVWQAFLHVQSVARWTVATSRTVLGPPITATVADHASAEEGEAA